MKKLSVLLILMVLGFLVSVILISSVKYSSGTPGGKTGSPLDGATCSQCHSGSSDIAVEGWITSDIPAEGYTIGDTFNFEVTMTDSEASLFGFEITAENEGLGKAGTFLVVDNVNTKVAANYITHKKGLAVADSTFVVQFKWVAPESDAVPVTFYGAFNGANGNASTSGDQIYLSELSVIGQGPISVKDLSNNLNNNVSFYPNPAGDDLSVRIKKLLTDKNTKFEIFNLEGKVLISGNLKNADTNIDISELPEGNYILKITSQNYFSTEKLIVRR